MKEVACKKCKGDVVNQVLTRTLRKVQFEEKLSWT